MRKYLFPAVIIILLTVVYCTNKPENTTVIEDNEITNIIKAPLDAHQINLTDYNIDTSKDTLIRYNSATIIRIPQAAFLDKDGNVITSKVKVRFRSFSNPIEIFLSGLPMEYTSNGEDKVFESAGMVEILANADGKEVFTNPNSKIEIDFLSLDSSNEFNVYNLDTISGQWQEQGKDLVTVEKIVKEMQDLPKIPTPPKVAGLNAFSIEDTTNEISHISMYENVLFEPIDGKKCGFSATNIDVEDLKDGTYKVNFKIDFVGTKKQSCICYLAFKKGEQYNDAFKVYQKKYAKELKLQTQKRAALERKWSTYSFDLKNYREHILRQNIDNLDTQEKITRTLSVNNFGFINIDKPVDYPQGASFIASYVDTQNNPLKLTNVVLVEKERNVLFRYKNQIRYNPEKANILWGLTTAGALAYFNEAQFEGLSVSSKKQTLTMNIISPEKLSYDMIKSLFSID
jgi:hypothetical protein